MSCVLPQEIVLYFGLLAFERKTKRGLDWIRGWWSVVVRETVAWRGGYMLILHGGFGCIQLPVRARRWGVGARDEVFCVIGLQASHPCLTIFFSSSSTSSRRWAWANRPKPRTAKPRCCVWQKRFCCCLLVLPSRPARRVRHSLSEWVSPDGYGATAASASANLATLLNEVTVSNLTLQNGQCLASVSWKRVEGRKLVVTGQTNPSKFGDHMGKNIRPCDFLSPDWTHIQISGVPLPSPPPPPSGNGWGQCTAYRRHYATPRLALAVCNAVNGGGYEETSHRDGHSTFILTRWAGWRGVAWRGDQGMSLSSLVRRRFASAVVWLQFLWSRRSDTDPRGPRADDIRERGT